MIREALLQLQLPKLTCKKSLGNWIPYTTLIIIPHGSSDHILISLLVLRKKTRHPVMVFASRNLKKKKSSISSLHITLIMWMSWQCIWLAEPKSYTELKLQEFVKKCRILASEIWNHPRNVLRCLLASNPSYLPPIKVMEFTSLCFPLVMVRVKEVGFRSFHLLKSSWCDFPKI